MCVGTQVGSMYEDKKIKFVIVIFMFFLSSCSKINPCGEEEVSRILSMDSKVDAVVLKKSCGATTSSLMQVFIVKTGEKIEGEPVFKADKIIDLEVSWSAPKKLTIEYKEARIFNFKNFWLSRDVDNFDYIVTIVEAPSLQ